jgi:hypothetical protein
MGAADAVNEKGVAAIMPPAEAEGAPVVAPKENKGAAEADALPLAPALALALALAPRVGADGAVAAVLVAAVNEKVAGTGLLLVEPVEPVADKAGHAPTLGVL